MSSLNKIKTMTVAALLCAIGIVIPFYSPFKIIIDPMSFTLASHVAIFIAMFISPVVGIFVAFGTAFGFLIGGYQIIIVFRAFSQIIFILIGALILKKYNNILLSLKSLIPFVVFISIIHALGELAAVYVYYSFNAPSNVLTNTIIYLVGFGTFVHSLVDFTIAYLVWKPIQFVVSIPANAKIRTRPRGLKG